MKGPMGSKPTVKARSRATLDHAAPVLNVRIECRRERAYCALPVAEILARVHSADLLAELAKRMATPDFAVFCDWLESRGDVLGPALANFTGHLAALRRESPPPHKGVKTPSASIEPGLDQVQPF
jgi:hypothetical protein